jgi:hypothetical protein
MRADKMGFPHPARQWFSTELKEPLFDLLGSRAARERGIYNVGAVLADAERHSNGSIDFSGPLFRVAQYELWCRQQSGDVPSLANYSARGAGTQRHDAVARH